MSPADARERSRHSAGTSTTATRETGARQYKQRDRVEEDGLVLLAHSPLRVKECRSDDPCPCRRGGTLSSDSQ